MKIDEKRITEGKIEQWILVFVLVLVLFNVISTVFPDVLTAADSLNSSGFPLASFFQSGGALWYLVAAGLLFLVYRSFMTKKK